MAMLECQTGDSLHEVLAQSIASHTETAEKLPRDVHPETLSRMPRASRNDFTTEEDKRSFDHVLAFQPKQRVSRWLGPTGTRLQIPALAEIYNEQDRMLMRDQKWTDSRYIELTISVATRETNNKEEWLNHEPQAVALLGQKTVDIIRKREDPVSLDEKDATVIRFGRELFHQPKVSSETFADMERSFGKKGTLNLALIMCYYASNGLLMRAYDQHMDTSAECTMSHSGCLDAKHPIPSW